MEIEFRRNHFHTILSDTSDTSDTSEPQTQWTDEIPSVPAVETTPQEDEFQRLRDLFKSQPPRNSGDQMRWLDRLRTELGSDDLVKAYFKWTKNQNYIEQFVQGAIAPAFATANDISVMLNRINWKVGSNDLRGLNNILWRTRYNGGACCSLFSYGKLNFWLRVCGQPFTLPSVNAETCEAYGVKMLNPGFVLGMRYIPVDDASKKQDLICAPLGRIEATVLETSQKHSLNSGYVVLVEIRSDGNAGELLIIPDPDSQSSPLTKTPGWKPFSLITTDRVILKGAHSADLKENLPRTISFKGCSQSKVEIVATGSALGDHEIGSEGLLPIALFSREKSEQEGQ